MHRHEMPRWEPRSPAPADYRCARSCGRDRSAAPTLRGAPKLAGVTDPQRFPVRFLQVGHEVVDRTDLEAMPGVHRRLDHLSELVLVVFQRDRVHRPSGVPQLAVGVEIEGGRHASAAHDDDATGAQRMADTQLVPDIRILDGQIGDNQVRDEEP